MLRIDNIAPDYIDSEHALPDNYSTEIIVGNKLTDRSFDIDYAVERGSSYSSGKLTALYKGSSPLPFSQSSVIGDTVGITFSFTAIGNDIIMTALLTSTGDAATLKLSTKKIKI